MADTNESKQDAWHKFVQKGGNALHSVEHAAIDAPKKAGRAIGNAASSGQKMVKKGVKVATEPISKRIHRKSSTEAAVDEEELPDVPPDKTLLNMNVIMKKKLRGVSVKDFYETIWSEGNKTDKAPFYEPWLVASGKLDVNVEEWEFSEKGDDFKGVWCGESYPQKRRVTFRFIKTWGEARVTHTQYCRMEGDDRCVLAMTVEMNGIPFSDCFNVEIRWVASRIGHNDALIEVGLFVNFIKSTVLAGKIRSGATEQTTEAQLDLFKNVQIACHSEAEEAAATEEDIYEDLDVGGFSCSKVADMFSNLFGHPKGVLGGRNDDICMAVRGADKKLKAVISIIDKSGVNADQENVIRDEITAVNESLSRVLSALKER